MAVGGILQKVPILGDAIDSMHLYNMPLIGGFFDNPNEQALQSAMAESAAQLTAYRNEMLKARNQAMQNQMSAYAPAAQWASQVVPGMGVNTNPASMAKNPMSPEMMNQGVDYTPAQDVTPGQVLGAAGRGAAGGAAVGGILTSQTGGWGAVPGAVLGGIGGALTARGTPASVNLRR